MQIRSHESPEASSKGIGITRALCGRRNAQWVVNKMCCNMDECHIHCTLQARLDTHCYKTLSHDQPSMTHSFLLTIIFKHYCILGNLQSSEMRQEIRVKNDAAMHIRRGQ